MTADSSFHVETGALEKIRQVLIGASLTAPDNRVLESGLAIAEALGAKVQILHCAWPATLGMSRPDFEDFTNRRRAEMATLLKSLRRSSDPMVTSRVEAGAPYRTLLRVAEDIDAGLIVVGAAEKPIRRLGSTAEKLMRKANCPVLVVREELTLPLRRVLAPVDLSVLCADSFRCGMDFLGQLKDEERPEVDVLFVLDELQRHFGSQFSVEQVERFAREELARFVNENAGERFRATAVQSMNIGDPRHEILRAAEASRPDLIILGTHGRHGAERLLIGSIAAGVVRRAKGNVLIVPPSVAFGAEMADAIVEQTAPFWNISRA